MSNDGGQCIGERPTGGSSYPVASSHERRPHNNSPDETQASVILSEEFRSRLSCGLRDREQFPETESGYRAVARLDRYLFQ